MSHRMALFGPDFVFLSDVQVDYRVAFRQFGERIAVRWIIPIPEPGPVTVLSEPEVMACLAGLGLLASFALLIIEIVPHARPERKSVSA